MKAFAIHLAAALALPFTAAAQRPDPLGLDEALRLSLERQPALTAYDRTAQAYEEAAVAARQLPDPRLIAGVQNLPVTGGGAFSLDADFMTMRFIGIGREQVRGAKRRAAGARLLAEAEVSLAEQQLLALRIQREVLLAWTTALHGHHEQDVLQSLIEKLEARLAAAEAGIPTGRATTADAVAIRAEIAAVRASLEQARGAEGSGRASLARWIGEAAQRPLQGELPICRPPSRDRALALVEDHPQIEVARSRNLVADRAVAVARADRLPDWGWSVMYGNRGGNRSDMLTVQLSVDLPLNRARLQNRRVAEAGELAAAARDRLEDARRELAAELEQGLALWHAAEARYRTTATQTLPALQAAERALEARFAAGSGGLESVILASERTTRTSLDLLEQRANVARISADLLFLLEECAE